MPSGGRIINVGSCNAERMPFMGGGDYATTDFTKMLMQVMALQRYGTGDEIVSLVAYLASPRGGLCNRG